MMRFDVNSKAKKLQLPTYDLQECSIFLKLRFEEDIEEGG